MMIITAVKIRRLENTGNKMIGVCSITLDSMIAIHDIKILEKDGHMFLAMPSRKTTSNTFKDIVHPISSEPREHIEQIIFGLYERIMQTEYASVDFKCTNEKCVSLLSQSAEDFDIDIFQKSSFSSRNASKDTGHQLTGSSNEDDELKKWLEGQS